MASAVYAKGLTGILNGDIDVLTDTLVAILVTSGYSLDNDDDFVSDLTPASNELSGAGYSRATLASKAVAEDDTNNRATFDAADVVWTGINAGTAAAVVIAKNSGADATSVLIAYIDTGGFPVATNGGDLTIQWNASGIFYI